MRDAATTVTGVQSTVYEVRTLEIQCRTSTMGVPGSGEGLPRLLNGILSYGRHILEVNTSRGLVICNRQHIMAARDF